MIDAWEGQGGPAFPVTVQTATAGEERITFKGMSLRDWFAGQALASLVGPALTGSPQKLQDIATRRGVTGAEAIALTCYDIADAMLTAREEPKDAP